MRPFLATILLLTVSTSFGIAEDKTKPSEYDVQRCAPKLLTRKHSESPEFHLRKGEIYKHSPVVAYEILESGEITHTILKRSSGINEIDKYALQWVQELKFNKRRGCGVVDSTADITIDLR